jgi:cell wall-associated NlpC family hydrolase
MEGQSDSWKYTKQLFIILPILFTHFNSQASNENPYPPVNPTNKATTFNAIPIVANTLAAYKNLKTVQTEHIKDASVTALEPVVTTVLAVTNATEMVTSETLLPEAMPAVANVEKVSAGTEAAVSNLVNSSFSFAALSMDEKRQYIAYFAESHTDWGFRYQYGGTALDKGIDCSGFTRHVLGYFDIKAPRTSGEQYDVGSRVSVENAQKGDLVFFGGKKSITHVAVVIENGADGLVVVHSCNRGIVKENITKSSYWKPKLKNTAVSLF